MKETWRFGANAVTTKGRSLGTADAAADCDMDHMAGHGDTPGQKLITRWS
jgi:hypothetical protein